MSQVDVIHQLITRWNAGDLEGAADLYTEDGEMRTGSHWPEHVTYRGRDEIRDTSREWASLWESLQVELESLEEYGDKVVATGSWHMRGASSGVDGEMDIFILFTFRGGKIAVLEWFPDRNQAVAAARDA
jgi:ketosteroid isomerase-like protein